MGQVLLPESVANHRPVDADGEAGGLKSSAEVGGEIVNNGGAGGAKLARGRSVERAAGREAVVVEGEAAGEGPFRLVATGLGGAANRVRDFGGVQLEQAVLQRADVATAAHGVRGGPGGGLHSGHVFLFVGEEGANLVQRREIGHFSKSLSAEKKDLQPNRGARPLRGRCQEPSSRTVVKDPPPSGEAGGHNRQRFPRAILPKRVCNPSKKLPEAKLTSKNQCLEVQLWAVSGSDLIGVFKPG